MPKAPNTFRLLFAFGDLDGCVAGAPSPCCKYVERIDESESPRVRRVRAGSIPPRSSGDDWGSMTASTFRESELGLSSSAAPIAQPVARPSVARRN